MTEKIERLHRKLESLLVWYRHKDEENREKRLEWFRKAILLTDACRIEVAGVLCHELRGGAAQYNAPYLFQLRDCVPKELEPGEFCLFEYDDDELDSTYVVFRGVIALGCPGDNLFYYMNVNTNF